MALQNFVFIKQYSYFLNLCSCSQMHEHYFLKIKIINIIYFRSK